MRLWIEAFPKQSSASELLDPDVDVDALARLELTGAGIFSTAQAAAFFAAEEGATTIKAAHIMRALERQFQREARVFTVDDFPINRRKVEAT